MAGSRSNSKGHERRPTGILDRVLTKRVQALAERTDVDDIPHLADLLRTTFKEYQRRQRGPFLKQVERAAQLARQARPEPEAQLQTFEEQHLSRAQSGAQEEPTSESTSYGSDGSSSSGADMDIEGVADIDKDIEAASLGALAAQSRLNSALISVYAKAPALPEEAAEGAAAAEPSDLSAPGQQSSVRQKETALQQGAAQKGAETQAAGNVPAEVAQGPAQLKPSGSTDTAKGRRRPEQDPGKGDRSLKRKRPSLPSMAMSSAIKEPRPVRYSDLGGIEAVLHDIRELVEYPLQHPEVYAWLGVDPPRGVLLHGPPGCGKTALANAIANECNVPFLRISAPEIVAGVSGESEAKVRQLFQEAADVAPCIVFIDEIDAIAAKRESAQREMERRIVAQMLTCLDDLVEQPSAAPLPDGAPLQNKHVVVIGATNRPESLDPALRRAGRFDRELSLGIPSQAARVRILQVLARRMRLEGTFDFAAVAAKTPGYVGADLAALTKEAGAHAITRVFSSLKAADKMQESAEDGAPSGGAADMVVDAAADAPEGLNKLRMAAPEAWGVIQPLTPAELAGLAITAADFDAAVKKVQPSVRREGFATTPDVTWNDVGALTDVREELAFSITQPIRHPERFAALGLSAPTGVLLYGPPGCGKTLVAKASANESGANFISIKGPELLNKYVGESERAVRQLFARARAAQPCVLFFDELDALAPRRGSDSNQSSERVVNQLLTEMDGTDVRAGVYVLAATNRPDIIDPALLRPGRLDKLLYVPLPGPEGRVAILRTQTMRTPLAPDVDLQSIGQSPRVQGFSGADLAALAREAAVLSLKEALRKEKSAESAGPALPCVHMHHFEAALSRVQPSVSPRDHLMYESLRQKLRRVTLLQEPNSAGAEAGGASTGLAE
ncbi:g9897 [Coccomyxa viridis]|uniref:G9897 protein n=1 Tax=Coccomyxa viridis TaxID=1274662 RepID=A0ABP1G8B3_9CHLO